MLKIKCSNCNLGDKAIVVLDTEYDNRGNIIYRKYRCDNCNKIFKQRCIT